MSVLAKLRTDINRANRMLAQLKPQSAPGILTNRTTRGVTREPINKEGNGTGDKGNVARWA